MAPVGARLYLYYYYYYYYIPEIEYYGEPRSTTHITPNVISLYFDRTPTGLATVRTDFENVCPARLMTRRLGE